MSVCVCVCMYVCMYVCVYVCMYVRFGLVYWGLTPQQQPGSYQGGEMMMKSVFWWRKPEYHVGGCTDGFTDHDVCVCM